MRPHKQTLTEKMPVSNGSKFAVISRNIFPIGLIMFVASLFFTAAFIFAGNRGNNEVASSSCPVDACVNLLSGSAEPETVIVTKGQYVQFKSADGEKHNIELAHSGAQHKDPSRYESGDFQKDEAWKVQFKEDGTYTFRDKYNEAINVSVVTYTPGEDYKIN